MAKSIERVEYKQIKDEFEADPTALMKKAGDENLNLSQYMNTACPDVLLQEKRSIGNKLMEDYGYVVKEASFVRATPYSEFCDTNHGRALAYDYIYRKYFVNDGRRDVPLLPSSNTTTLYDGGNTSPQFEDSYGSRFDPNTLVALQTPASGTSVKVFRWKPTSANDVKRERVAPGAQLPGMVLSEVESPIELHKWGIAAELTYEAVRRQSLDKVGAMLQLEMDVENARQVAQFTKVLKDGDERNGKTASDGSTLDTTAVEVKRSVIDPTGSANTLSLKGLMAFLAGWPVGRVCNYILARSARAVDIALLTTGSSNIPISFLTNVGAAGIPGFSIPGLGGPITVLIVEDADLGANEILGIDSRASLEKVNEEGSNIRQQAQDIKNQTEVMTFSDTYGLAKLILKATRVYNID